MSKKQIVEKLQDFYSTPLTGKIEKIIEDLQSYKEQYLKYSNLEFVDESSWDQTSFVLYGTREETDKEFVARQKKAAKIRAVNKKKNEQKRKDELALYESLKKKFG